jgi:hypothetical protein
MSFVVEYTVRHKRRNEPEEGNLHQLYRMMITCRCEDGDDDDHNTTDLLDDSNWTNLLDDNHHADIHADDSRKGDEGENLVIVA